MNLNLRPKDLTRDELDRLLATGVAPRPIAWVSTVGPDGSYNLTPYSYFNVICTHPPLFSFNPAARNSFKDGGPFSDTFQKTLHNVRASGEFVINVVTVDVAERMNLTAGPSDSTDPFQAAGLSARPSQVVRAPQVAESPVSFECKLDRIVEFGTEEYGARMIIGEAVSVYVSEGVTRNGRVDADLLELVGRLGGTQYCLTNRRYEMTRPDRNVAAVSSSGGRGSATS